MPNGYLIGVDTGGTFTDCLIDGPDGLSMGKAFSTPGKLWQGIIDAIAAAAEQTGGIEQVLANATALVHGTTAMLNAVLTGSGSVVGMLTTRGFEDTLSIGRVHQRVAGLSEWEITDALSLRKSLLFRDKRLIIGLKERIDARGRVLRALDLEEVRSAVEILKRRGAESFAVNFLWSGVNGEHERNAALAIKEMYPDVAVTISSDLTLRVGEYERFAASAINAYVTDIARGYLGELRERLSEWGFSGQLLLMRSWGDLEHADRVTERAVFSLNSGPIGGATGARAIFGGRLVNGRAPLILCADVGGTSFDVALIERGELRWTNTPIVEKLHIAVPTVEIASIGTGGGSIASYDVDLHLIHVGPKSAGAMPGPACYGRGGTQPTLTDAAVVAGWIPTDLSLPGGLMLSLDRAKAAIAGEIADPAGMSVERSAAAILRIACAQMADLVRKACVERAVDPRAVLPLIYGGAGAQYAGAICGELGLARFLVPEIASTFSAFGLLTADEGVVLSRSIGRTLPVDHSWLASELETLESSVRSEFGEASASYSYFAELKYRRQINELRIDVDRAGLLGEDLGAFFAKAYEEKFGSGTAYSDAAIELSAIGIHATRPLHDHDVHHGLRAHHERSHPHDGKELAFMWLDGSVSSARCTTYEAMRGNQIEVGPALIVGSNTTVVVPPGWSSHWNDELNMLEVSRGD